MMTKNMKKKKRKKKTNKKTENILYKLSNYLIMSNDVIIKEFEKLISFYKNEQDEALKLKDTKKATANSFRLKQLKTVLTILKSYPDKITLSNYESLKELDGIGAHTIARIKEILEKGKLSELSKFKDTSGDKETIINELENIVGVGRSKALEFYNMGITSIKMLKQKIKKGEIEVNDKILLGLKYYGLYEGNIPRKEIDEIKKIISRVIKGLNKKYSMSETDKYIFEICGSYRREKPTSGDIDVLISKLDIKDTTKDEINHLERVVKELKSEIKSNNEKPLLVDDITDKNYETKYMGFAKLKDNPVRRIDIRFVSYDSYYSALLYFTGSADLNKQMRIIAKEKKLKLSEYGLFKEDGTKLKIKSEEDFFKKLGMEYIEPKDR
jgi:DNA polymerase/3'-5' exonuclease PolX